MVLLFTLASCAPATPVHMRPLPATASAQAKATPPSTDPDNVRRASAAGRYYSDDARLLAAQIDGLLADAEPYADHPVPMALVVPHAGYVYSGHVAAQAYKQIEGREYEAIIVLGVNHQDPGFREVSVWAQGGFETPLGLALVDEELASALLGADKRLVFDREVHKLEHSVEVQLPFLQRIYGESLRFVPVVIGEPSDENCRAAGKAIAEVVKGRRVLIVASADLAHYPAYDDAVRADMAMLRSMTTLDSELLVSTREELMDRGIPGLATCSCGEGPVRAAMIAAEALGANQAAIVRYANSGDTPFGQRDQVVGYGAVMFWQGAAEARTAHGWLEPADVRDVAPLEAQDRAALLKLARYTLQRYLTVGDAPVVRPEEDGLWQKRGAFVTIKRDGELRGCIGELVGSRPLYLSVQWAALSAALADDRFPPVTADELARVDIEISVLSPLREVRDVSAIQVGVHGLVIAQGEQRGVLLPQVAVEEGWDRMEFLHAACRKAGLPVDAWQAGETQLYAFEAEVFGEG